jgi:hypothetical protein
MAPAHTRRRVSLSRGAGRKPCACVYTRTRLPLLTHACTVAAVHVDPEGGTGPQGRHGTHGAGSSGGTGGTGGAFPLTEPVLRGVVRALRAVGRGLHWSAFRLNISALCGIGGVFRGYLGGVKGVSGVIWVAKGVFLCPKRLRLS